jgi:predicted transcriptional regulator
LKKKRSEGALQSEIHKELKLSKSRVSEVLSELERNKEVVRESIGKSYRVWFFKFAPRPIEGVMRIGILKAAEYPHVLMAAERMKNTIHVEVFKDALELTKSLSMSQVDVAFSPFITQTLFALLLKSIKIHCIAAYNGSGIILKGEIGETFATSELSAMESNLKLFLEKSGIDPSKLSFRYFECPERMIESFSKCEVNALAIWEPYFTMLKKERRHIEFKEVIGDFPCCSMASNIKFYEGSKEILKEFMGNLKNCVEEIDRRKEYAARLLAKKMGFDEKLVLRSFDSYKFSASFKEGDLEFLDNYGLKLTKESLCKILET